MAIKYGAKVRELMIKEMENIFRKKGVVFSSYDKIKASDIDAFRKKVKKSGSRYFVVKKRLAKLAMENTGMGELAPVLEEKKNVGVTVIEDDPVTVAKLLVDFSKENSNFNLSSGYLEGRVLEAARVKELAALPSREQLLSMVLSAMNGPVNGFVNVLATLIRNFSNVLNAIKEKKEKGE